MKRARILPAAMLSALAVGLWGGCGEKVDTSGSAQGTPARSDDATLTVSIPGDIDNFDPYSNQLIQYEWAIRSNVFDTLVRYDDALNLVPGLADPESSDDATEFTFTLRDGVRFSDGEPLDAQAVVTSLKAAARSKGIYAARLADVERYETPDARTVTIRLRHPNAAFLDGLTKIAIVAPKHLDDAKTKPVGSGPYTFESWTPNDRIVLARNDDYWGPKPPYAKLVLRPISDEQVALNSLYAGEVDVVGSASPDTVRQADTNRVQVIEPKTSNSIALVEMMGKSKKLADVRLRRAMAYAFDREAIKKIAYGDRGESTWSLLPSGSWAFKEETGYPYDLERAKALVDEAGATGTTVTLDVLTGTPEAEKMARVWQQSLAKVGIELKVRTSELSVWLDRYVKHDYDAIWNYFNVSGDPDSLFDVILKPHLDDQYDKPAMTTLIREAVATIDQDKRAALYGRLQDMLVEDLPVLPVQSRPLAAITAKDVTGVRVNPLGWPLLIETGE
jgi:peptide/nickel transport system substrate-binding protein